MFLISRYTHFIKLKYLIFLKRREYKIFTKLANNRLNSVADKMIHPSKSAFMHGRHILDGVVVLP
jgi:hypothetical protein